MHWPKICYSNQRHFFKLDISYFLCPWYSYICFVTIRTSNQVLIRKKDEKDCIPLFSKSILTKFVRAVRPFIFSIIRNHPTDAMKRCEKNAYEKIAILRKCAAGYAATSLTCYSSVCVFFFLSGFSFRNIHVSQNCRERGRLSL